MTGPEKNDLRELKREVAEMKTAIVDFNGKAKTMDSNIGLLNTIVTDLKGIVSAVKQRQMDDFSAVSTEIRGYNVEQKKNTERLAELIGVMDRVDVKLKKVPCLKNDE